MRIRKTIGAMLIATVAFVGAMEVNASAKVFPPELYVGGFLLGPQAYTFNRFSLMEAIDKTKEVGCSVIEIYPGQRFSPENDARFSHDSDPSLWAQAKIKLERTGVRVVNYGVVGLPNNEEQARKVFDFAKIMGIPTITSEPSIEAMDLLEELVKEYDIKLAIHNHPSNPNNPNYRIWDPEYVLEMVQDRDPRIGACADSGHWMRSGVNPLEAIQLLEGRIISLHLKDLNEFDNRGAHDVIFGQGEANIEEILLELRRQHFTGNISIEYEHNWDDNVGDVAQCVDFIREFGKRHDAVN